MATTLCNCCGESKDSLDTVLLVMPDMTIRRVCLKDINTMWKKRNPELREQRETAKAARRSSDGNR